ncbi:CLUMA_CG000963, isoform A [Clunio marinus]|uniref:CLUMA_CG000963, isoform A n=1 Tax=Clunio marinus TaxID=568069 RepID=A0A1J1HHX5_9DIPT|nr:CLUMA_CG000963, isoform A [Clunio marinus]
MKASIKSSPDTSSSKPPNEQESVEQKTSSLFGYLSIKSGTISLTVNVSKLLNAIKEERSMSIWFLLTNSKRQVFHSTFKDDFQEV